MSIRLIRLTTYNYKEEGPIMLKNHRDDSGKVVLAPKGFFTNSMKPGIANSTTKVTIGDFPTHMVDEYERVDDMKINENKKNRDKALYQPFKTSSYGKPFFLDAKTTFGLDKELPPKPAEKQAESIHTKPFKCSNPPKLGYNKTINRITYAPEGEQLDRKRSALPEMPWKPSGEVDKMGFSNTGGLRSDFKYML